MVVGELFLSAFIQALFKQLLSPELLKFASREGIRQKLDEWSETLSRIQAVLDDAEDRQDNNDRAVKLWLNDLKDLAYDVDDILDEFATEVLRRKLLGENQSSTSKVRKLIPACCTCLTPSAVKINIRMRPKITEITTRFNYIVKQKDDLKLSEAVDGRRSNRERERLQPTSVINKALIFGREKDKENVVELLLTENSSGAGVGVVSIVGMGGMGKTTLAQLVHNDEKLKHIFEVKAWVCVSDDFDVVRVTKAVLKSVGTSENCEGQALDWLQVQLKEKLQGKKFLVVMDDVWNEKNYIEWTKLRVPFEAGAPGSKILVTTRSKGVSSLMGTVDGPVYDLQLLSDDVCLSILSLHALDKRDFSAFPDLKDIGEDIAKKCKGLPLAATTIGGLLRSTKRGRDEWKEVLDSRIWDATDEGSNGIVPALKLSYHHLPSRLKRCFAYCSIFPKDYEFEKQKLVLLWMAEGFIIEREEGGKKMEDFGGEYFSDLVSRSFFQESSYDMSRFVMHDLISDLAESVAGDTCFRVEDGSGRSNKCEIPKKARHSSYLADEYDGVKKFGAFSDGTHLRTFISLSLVRRRYCYLTRRVPYELLPKLQCLRVLTLGGCQNIFGLPDSIGVLKHLRYVDLSYAPIESLPESMTTFCNLQTLLLEECDALKKLPSEFGKLVNLRHLNIEGARSLEGMPPRLGKLTCLQTLSDFVVGEGSCSGIQELGPLSHLRGTLRISRLEKVKNIGDAKDANLLGKSKLDRLVLEWSPRSQNRRSDEFESVLNMLRPNNSLKELTIKNYDGTKFPTWLGGPSFPNMVLLRIESCKSCTSLPPIGQLVSLKYLLIRGMTAVKNVGPEFYGEGCSQPFKSLEELSFENMEEWEHWTPPGEFPRLRYLVIYDCPKLLGKLPNHLPSLETVEINGSRNLVVSISNFPEHCKLRIDDYSKAVVCKNKVDFSSLDLTSLSDFTCGIEGLNMEGLINVEELYIESCEEMKPLWSNEVGLLRHLPRLRSLEILWCPRLVSLVAEEVEEQLPYTVKEITIRFCKVLQSLPKSMMYNNTCLECIDLIECHSLTHFAKGQLPPTLKRLQIYDCPNFRILLDGDDDINSCGSTSHLESLRIEICGSLKCLTLSGELPATLKKLSIYRCGQLKSVAKRLPHNSLLKEINIGLCGNLKSLPMGLDSLAHLHKIYISGCPKLVWHADGESLPANLRMLSLVKCDKMQGLLNNIHNLNSLRELKIEECLGLSFPEEGFPLYLTSLIIDKMQGLPNNIHNLTSLQNLEIKGCPGLSFLEEGFPLNLTSLTIGDLNMALFDWGLQLHNLTSIKDLHIYGGSSHLISFPEMMLPASLTSLTIRDFPKLESLSSKGFQMLASLENLTIWNCRKLSSLPKDGLPPTILSFEIYDCPFLKERCKKEGQERSKIAHIPCVQLDWVVFQF